MKFWVWLAWKGVLVQYTAVPICLDLYTIINETALQNAFTVIDLFSALCAKLFQNDGKFLKYFFSFKRTFLKVIIY